MMQNSIKNDDEVSMSFSEQMNENEIMNKELNENDNLMIED